MRRPDSTTYATVKGGCNVGIGADHASGRGTELQGVSLSAKMPAPYDGISSGAVSRLIDNGRTTTNRRSPAAKSRDKLTNDVLRGALYECK